jgi:hypothetical protein
LPANTFNAERTARSETPTRRAMLAWEVLANPFGCVSRHKTNQTDRSAPVKSAIVVSMKALIY